MRALTWSSVMVVAVCCAFMPARAAANERATVSIAYGPIFSKKGGDSRTQPSLWFDAGFRLVGPLQFGVYGQGIGDDWGFKDPGFGGGAQLALRPTFSRVHIIAALHGGYLKYPVTSARKDGVWNFGATLGVGVSLIRWLGLEVRGRYSRFFDNGGAPSHGWTLEPALAFYIGGNK